MCDSRLYDSFIFYVFIDFSRIYINYYLNNSSMYILYIYIYIKHNFKINLLALA